MTIDGVPPFAAGPPSPSRILRPGLHPAGKPVERYHVPGGGSICLTIGAGDELTIIDVEGGQPVEVVLIGADGKVAPGLADGAARRAPADGLRRLLGERGPATQRMRDVLKQRRCDLARAQALVVSDRDACPGQAQTLTVTGDGLAIIATPGPIMDPGGHDTSTPAEVRIVRAKTSMPATRRLPEPLADPVQDIAVRSATAEAYLVKQGEYIQIIDVEGRQCTDFQCFDRRKLDRGRDTPLDATTTRTLLGASYPLPGIPAKAFDEDMDPLVEVIQDTCGRHDAFLLACTARYYDDMGYPGHANCTDNFNAALAPYGVNARSGWMALNYFYNTGIDDNHAVYLDEPWSRPGDYVLLRALTDLVCVSSACPDDIDPANGWNPTDIHVRTYSPKQTFSRAVAYRMTPDSPPQLTRETGFHGRLGEHTRNFVEYRGFWLPECFAGEGPVSEYWACRQKAVVTDLSPLRKFEVLGPDAERLMQYTLTRDVRKLAVGQVVYSAMCYAHGGMLDDGTLFRLGENNFRWIGGDDYGGTWLRQQAETLGLEVKVRSSTDHLHNIAVQGPLSRDILADVVWTPPTQPEIGELGWFRFTIGRIGGFKGVPVVVSRTGYTGELGFEVFCHPSHCEAVFDAIWQAGEPKGLKPMGLAALDMVRIEAGLIFYGYEFSDETDPFEAGIGFTVPLKSKADDFIGREALVRRKEHPQRKLVGLELDGDETIGHGDCVHVGRAQVGVVTSATRSPILRKTIALARLDVAYADIGTEVEIGKLDGHQKRLPAQVVAFPHYDPKKTRVRA